MMADDIKVSIIGGGGSSSFDSQEFGKIGRRLCQKELMRECLGERRRRFRSDPNIYLSCGTSNVIGREQSFETRCFRMLGRKLLTTSLHRFPNFREERIE
jgi:hypothetical protein